MILISALFALLAILLLVRGSRAAQRGSEPDVVPPPRRRVQRLCAGLTGSADRDRPLLNRILALGDAVIPTLIAEVGKLRQCAPEGSTANRLARMEEVIADFGLAAVPPVTDAMARLPPSSPLTPSLLRIVERLGRSGRLAAMDRGLSVTRLAPFLPRFGDPRSTTVDALLEAVLKGRTADTLEQDLDLLAGHLAHGGAELSLLWERWDIPSRAAYLSWLTRWLPLATSGQALRGLADPSAEVRIVAARLATLLVDTELVQPLATLSRDSDVRCRRAAVRALSAQCMVGGREPLLIALGDPDAFVATEALIGLLRTPTTWAGLPQPPALKDAPVTTFLSTGEMPSNEALIEGLEDERSWCRVLSAHFLALSAKTDPCARERLILLADSDDVEGGLLAVSALAQVGDQAAADLVVRALRSPPMGDGLLTLQVAAQHAGEKVVSMLARRLRTDTVSRLQGALTVMRSLPYSDAVPALLRSLEDARTNELEALLSATLFVGGDDVREAIRDALTKAERGLMIPALRYVAAYGHAADVPLLVELFERHGSLRSVLLNLIEIHGQAALDAIETRIARGGEDDLLLSLEKRRAVLDACLHERSTVERSTA